MLDYIFNLLLSQAAYAHYYILLLFFLAGFNVPVSEDVLFIAAAIISVKILPENTYILFFSCYIGAYGSDIICYWVGRVLGLRIVKVKPFNKLVDEKRLNMMMQYYEKYGSLTLVIGRFIPFGVRNAIFLTSGISKMHFGKFALLDGLACTVTSLILFSLGRTFAHNYELLFEKIQKFNYVIIAIAIIALFAFLFFKRRKKKIDSESSAA